MDSGYLQTELWEFAATWAWVVGERGETNMAPVAVAWDTEKGEDWQQSRSDGEAGGTEDHNLE